MCNLVHGLADADSGRQVEDSVNSLQGTTHNRNVPSVAANQLGLKREVVWCALAMNLHRKTIQNSYVMPGRNQRIHQVRPYESCSTRYQNVSIHADSAPIRTSEVFFARTYLRTAHRAKSTKSSALRGGLA